jgi:hypothetical protein
MSVVIFRGIFPICSDAKILYNCSEAVGNVSCYL